MVCDKTRLTVTFDVKRLADSIRYGWHNMGITRYTRSLYNLLKSASPYTLMEMARLGLVYTSTAGLEMAIKGKPVIVAGNVHYTGTEFVYTPRSRAEFLNLLAKLLPPRPDQLTYAERYAYMLFFELPVPCGDLIKQVGGDYQFVGDIRNSTILERAGLT